MPDTPDTPLVKGGWSVSDLLDRPNEGGIGGSSSIETISRFGHTMTALGGQTLLISGGTNFGPGPESAGGAASESIMEYDAGQAILKEVIGSDNTSAGATHSSASVPVVPATIAVHYYLVEGADGNSTFKARMLVVGAQMSDCRCHHTTKTHTTHNSNDENNLQVLPSSSSV